MCHAPKSEIHKYRIWGRGHPRFRSAERSDLKHFTIIKIKKFKRKHL